VPCHVDNLWISLAVAVACGNERDEGFSSTGFGPGTSPNEAGATSEEPPEPADSEQGSQPDTHGPEAGDTEPPSDTEPPGGSAESDVSTAGEEASLDPKFDLRDGVGSAGDDGATDGCQKVDFLFVIDNSASMAEEQDNLIESFPGFIAAIEEATSARDFHIMVVDSDWQQPLFFCSGQCAELFPPTSCGATNCAAFEQPGAFTCDESIGVGIVNDLEDRPCAITGGNRYLIDAQPDLSDAFACIARVGTGGATDELIFDAMRFAVSDTFNDPGGCHPGFVRKDAILVLTFVTDETDVDLDAPQQTRDAIVAAKGDNADATVVLGLFGDTDQPNAVCTTTDQNAGGAHDGDLFRLFIDKFPNRGSWASVCETDYAPFFARAVSVIDTTCDEFVPEG